MTTDEKYMHRCLQLAKNGIGNVAPNPMVGSVIVHNDVIIGEGYHVQYGQAHAEPNAINAVKDQSLLQESTLYVNLEPCSHFGKTPPCSAYIIEKKIPRVVIGSIDPNPEVSGRGIKMMQDAGIEVVCGLLLDETRELNKRFFASQEKKRPYIFLKWAQSVDGFIDGDRNDKEVLPVQFSTTFTQQLNHKSRSEEGAILVATNTVLMDNPQLTTREWDGENPLRLVIDKEGKISDDYKVKDNQVPTLIFTENPYEGKENLTYIIVDFSQDIIPQILKELYKRKINSLIVEGGRTLLQSFIDGGIWDEARVEIAPVKLRKGISSPIISMANFDKELSVDGNKIMFFKKEI